MVIRKRREEKQGLCECWLTNVDGMPENHDFVTPTVMTDFRIRMLKALGATLQWNRIFTRCKKSHRFPSNSRGENCTFIMEKSGYCHLSQGIKFSIAHNEITCHWGPANVPQCEEHFTYDEAFWSKCLTWLQSSLSHHLQFTGSTGVRETS